MNDSIEIAAARYVVTAQRLVTSHMALFGGDVIDGYIFQAVVAANIAHVDSSPDMPSPWADLKTPQIPLEGRRPIAISALAASLDMPRQTVWRRLQRLIKAKLILQTGAGVLAPPGDPRGNAYDAALTVNTSLLIAFLAEARLEDEARDHERLAALAVLRRPDAPHRTVGRLSTTFILYVITEFSRRTTGDVVDGYIQVGLALACASPGRDGRPRPLNAAPTRDVAEVTGLAEETMRRRLHGLVRAGFAERTPRGYAPAWRDGVSSLPEALAIGVTRLIRQLARLG
ncbi:winged helix-turn-helix domain-containing protein [Phenylobacterium sp.]|uniref:winged helix-turn-helix domain-containing protein n=1 Tax=Phenylobacterium sp. TaxID=1871053 RepID=UPI0030F3B027